MSVDMGCANIGINDMGALNTSSHGRGSEDFAASPVRTPGFGN